MGKLNPGKGTQHDKIQIARGDNVRPKGSASSHLNPAPQGLMTFINARIQKELQRKKVALMSLSTEERRRVAFNTAKNIMAEVSPNFLCPEGMTNEEIWRDNYVLPP